MNRSTRYALLAALLAALLVATTTTHASLIAYDGFTAGTDPSSGDYTAGANSRFQLTGQNPTLTGFTGTWTQSITTFELGTTGTTQTGSLTYSDGTNNLATSGNTAFRIYSSGISSRQIDADLSTGTSYYSFLMKADGTDADGALIFGESDLSLSGGGFRIRADGGVLTAQAGFQSTDLGAVDTATHLFVMKLVAGTNDQWTIWMDPTDLSSEAGSTVTASGTVIGGSSMDITHLTLFKDNDAAFAKLAFDEVRIGATWSDVTPYEADEPPRLVWESDMSTDPTGDGWVVGNNADYTMGGGLLTMDAGAVTTHLDATPWNPFNGVTTVDLEWRATSFVADKGAGIWCNVDVDPFAETYGQVIFHSLLLGDDTQTFKIINDGIDLVTIAGFSDSMLTLQAVIDSDANTVSYEVTDGTTTKSGIVSYDDTTTWVSGSPACTLSTAGPSAEIDYVRIEANATLESYDDWAISYPGLTDGDATLDFDGGSLETGLEYVLGSDPTDASDDLAVAPISTMNGTTLEFDFRRTDVARDDSSTTIVAEYSLDLSGWTTAEDGVGGVTIAVTNDFYGVGIDRVVVSLPDTLAADDKIFARLKVTVAP